MNMFSKMDGMSGINPASSGVWKIEKKTKTRDEKNRSGKEKKKDREDNENDIQLSEDKSIPEDELYSEDQTGYGLTKKKKNKSTKIDIKI